MEDQNAPATKGDLEELRSGLRSEMSQLGSELRSEMSQLGSELRSEMSHGYNDIVERIADSETRLLKAFYAFAESNDKRMIQQDANIAVFLSRMATFESRLLAVEKRLDLPPAA
jgi:hypothetical protein